MTTQKTCKICGAPISGKAKFCKNCQKKKKRNYQKNHYNNNDDYRRAKLKSAEKQRKKPKIGSLYDYSTHAQDDFEKEAKVVQSMKRKSFGSKHNKKHTTNDDYNKEAYRRYNDAVNYEKLHQDSIRECEVCGGSKFERIRGEVVCMTCGTCYPTFCMSAFGFDELTPEDMESDFIKTLRRLGENNV